MDNATARRLLTTLADMLDNARALSDRGEVRLVLTPDFALQFASACEHTARPEEDAFSEFVPVEGRPGYVMHRPRRGGQR